MDAQAYADMLPWLVFLVIDRRSGLGVAWAGGGALFCSAGLVAWSYWRGRCSLVPRVALALFATCLVSGLASHAWDQQVSLPRALVVATLSGLAFVSLRFTPVSEAYTVPLVAPAIRSDPRFVKVNVEITLAWAVGSLAVAVASGTTALLSNAVFFTFLDWVTPLVLAAATILWATRRWELFRLAVDSVVVGHHLGDAALQAQDPEGEPFGSGVALLRPGAVPPLRLAGQHGRAEVAEGPGDDEDRDAIIRQLPIRGRHV
jgi:hypothetical protein